MEIDYRSREGRPVVSNWKHEIFVKRPEYDSNETVYLSFDFGTTLCGCFIAQYVPIQGFNAYQCRILDEVILQHANTPRMARETRQKMSSSYQRAWRNNHIISYCDWAGCQHHSTSDKSMTTDIKILNQYGFYPDSKKFGVPESTDVLETVFQLVLPNGDPAVVIHERCRYAIEVFGGGLRYPENGRPGYYEKDNYHDHGGDMGRYLFNNLFDEFALAGNEKPPVKKPTFIRRRYSGEIIGLRKSKRVNPRRGQHAVRNYR